MVWASLFGGWTELLGKAGELLGVASFLRERKNEKRRVRAEVERRHQDVWREVRSIPGFEALYDRSRDLLRRPRTVDETHCVRLILRHFAWALSEHRAGRYDLPERLADDLRNFFSYPVRKDAWLELQAYHDKAVVAFVERALAETA